MSGETRQSEQRTTPVCGQKTLLLESYRLATLQHSDAVAELNRKLGTSSRTEYQSMYRLTEALKRDAGNAQRELERHVAEHGC